VIRYGLAFPVDAGLPEKHFQVMHFGRRRPPDREFSDYSAVASTLQRRRSEKKLDMPSESEITDPSAVRAYRPEKRLADRGEKTRELVKDAAGIPRTWEPELPFVPQDEVWTLVTLVIALWANLAAQALVAYVISFKLVPSDDFETRLILLGLGAAAAIALVVCASRNISRTPACAGMVLALGYGELLAITICSLAR
jgi:hypothetical protein